jgi:membrane fusion protein (multidrug efflux system)
MDASKKKFPVKQIVIITVLLIAGYFGFKKIYFSVTHESTDNAQVETQIVPVLPRVSGYVKAVNVKDFDSVKQGQLIVELDDAELQSQMVEAEADVQQAKTEVINAEATLQNAVSTLAVNKANITLNELRKRKADEDQQRDQRLLNDGAITKKQADDSKFMVESTQQQLIISKNEYAAAQSRIAILKANIQKANDAVRIKEAKIGQLQLKISYTKIFAPLSGKIGKKNISEGQFIQAGTPMFSVVNDSTFWIVANFKESQLEALIPGKKVDVRIEAYPDLTVTGTIASLSEATGAKFALLPPDNSSGNFVKVTQRIPIKIWIDDVQKYHDMLRAGMSVFIVAEKK